MRPAKVVQKVTVTSESSVHSGMRRMEDPWSNQEQPNGFFLAITVPALEHSLGDDQNDVVIYSRRDVHKHPRTILYSVLFGSTDID